METNELLEEDILDLVGIIEERKTWNKYKSKYKEEDTIAVPRVTNILSSCKDSESLIRWAANVGRRKYDYYKNKALDIGTITHDMIDKYLLGKYVYNKEYKPNFYDIDEEYSPYVYNAYNNFIAWETNLNNLGLNIEKVVGLEIEVTCPWYGGTIDAILKINGAYYIIDFKTSKAINYEYLLQTSAYMWIVNNNYASVKLPHIDGIGIIRVDKSKLGIIDDMFITDNCPANRNIIEEYQRCFASYVNAYYRRINASYIYSSYSNNYNFAKDILG